jgi:hypothetical protein
LFPDVKTSFSTMLFVETPRPPRRSQAFAGSALLHCALILLLTMVSVKAPHDDDAVGHVNRKYSVRFLRLQMAQEHRQRAAPGMEQSQGSGLRQGAGFQAAAQGSQNQTASASGKSQPPLSAESVIKREHRLFELPPTAHVDPVKQTLVQLDLPPDIVLKHDIAIPTALLWTQRQTPPAMRKRFIAPPPKQAPKPAALPVPALLEPPNLEVNVADLNIASAPVNDTAHLTRPPAMATPVSTVGRETAKEIPQISVADSSEASAANLISLPDSPLRSSAMIVLPPANQIAPSASGNAGLSPGREGPARDGAQGTGTQGQGLSASGSGGVGTENQGAGDSGSGGAAGGKSGEGSGNSSGNGGAGIAGSGSGAGAGTGDAKSGSGRSGLGAGAGLGNGAGGAGGAGASGGPDGTLGGTAGVTRFTLPKDGQYGVVVVGSAPAAPYPESVGALGGKMVYTVYLRVGLRKKWILQYCLPKAVEQRIKTRGSATPLDAPWPFLILRPDKLSATGEEYVLVHGMITSEGHFEQLAMIFPEELEKKDLLISSLSKWEFRPSSRDGVPTTVEVLLIIPREAD